MRNTDVSGHAYGRHMIIDCDACVMRDIACADCVVPFLSGAPDLSVAETTAVSVLASSGLVPPLRMVRGRADDHGTAQGCAAVHGRRGA